MMTPGQSDATARESAVVNFTATLALREAVHLNSGGIEDELRRRFPLSSPAIELTPPPSEAAAASCRPGDLWVRVARHFILVRAIAAPRPLDVLDRPFRPVSDWPDGRSAIAAHRAYILVGAAGDSPDLADRISLAAAVTVVAAAVAAVTPTIGVIWEPAITLTSVESFLAQAEGIERQEWPIQVWITFVLFHHFAEGPTGLATVGLATFLGWELEFRPCGLPASALWERVTNSALYLLANGQVFGHGDTMGYDAEKRINISHLKRGVVHDGPTLCLTQQQH